MYCDATKIQRCGDVLNWVQVGSRGSYWKEMQPPGLKPGTSAISSLPDTYKGYTHIFMPDTNTSPHSKGPRL